MIERQQRVSRRQFLTTLGGIGGRHGSACGLRCLGHPHGSTGGHDRARCFGGTRDDCANRARYGGIKRTVGSDIHRDQGGFQRTIDGGVHRDASGGVHRDQGEHRHRSDAGRDQDDRDRVGSRRRRGRLSERQLWREQVL